LAPTPSCSTSCCRASTASRWRAACAATTAPQDCAIVALTALSSERVEARALAAGCDAVLSQPVIAAALVAQLVRLLARRSERLSAPDMTRVLGRG
jgi:CheY-like chemotaxis protein